MSDVELLAGTWLFRRVNKESLAKLAAFAFHKDYAPGESVFEEGQTGNGMFIVAEGKVEVVKGLAAGKPQRIATLGKGEVFGEMALLDELPRSATVRAEEPTSCVGIDRFLFMAQLTKDPQVAITMIQVLARRLRETNANL